MKRERTLVILAAGIGSRFAGGIKQLQSVGPSGEVIMDYSIHDVIEAGFNRFVCIIRHDIQELFDQIMGDRIRAICMRKGMEVLCAYQEKTNLPGGFVCPADRVKPWGTGHALLSCKGMLHGGVTRGLCRTQDGWLTHIRETKNIIRTPIGAEAVLDGRLCGLDEEIPVSMNMWGFTPDVLQKLEERFIEFLGVHPNEPRSEFLIPSEIGVLLGREAVRIRVLPTTSQWFGMTFAEDLPGVRKSFAEMAEQGVYSNPLFSVNEY